MTTLDRGAVQAVGSPGNRGAVEGIYTPDTPSGGKVPWSVFSKRKTMHLEKSQSATVLIGPFLDDEDFSALTSLSLTTSLVKLCKNGASIGNMTGSIGSHQANGMYLITLDSTATNTVGPLQLSCHPSGSLPCPPIDFEVVESSVYNMIYEAGGDLATTIDRIESDTQDVQSRLTTIDNEIATIDSEVGDLTTNLANLDTDVGNVLSKTNSLTFNGTRLQVDVEELAGTEVATLAGTTFNSFFNISTSNTANDVGGSSGGNVWAALEVAKRMEGPAKIVTVLPDSGFKYLSKIFNPAWLKEKGFGHLVN